MEEKDYVKEVLDEHHLSQGKFSDITSPVSLRTLARNNILIDLTQITWSEKTPNQEGLYLRFVEGCDICLVRFGFVQNSDSLFMFAPAVSLRADGTIPKVEYSQRLKL